MRQWPRRSDPSEPAWYPAERHATNSRIPAAPPVQESAVHYPALSHDSQQAGLDQALMLMLLRGHLLSPGSDHENQDLQVYAALSVTHVLCPCVTGPNEPVRYQQRSARY